MIHKHRSYQGALWASPVHGFDGQATE